MEKIKPFSMLTPEQRAKGVKLAGIARRRSISQFTKDMELVKVWSCTKTAGVTLGISTSNITKVLKGKRAQTGGYIWKYHN